MTGVLELPSDRRVFDEIAEDYDRHRPTYPDALIERACSLAGIGRGAAVLEIGCGTGQLTRSLLARGLRVTAIEPGKRLIRRAQDRLDGTGDVRFINATFEEAAPCDRAYQAVFSASAIHWVDPGVSWSKIADSLVDGGTLALLSYFGLDHPQSSDDQRELRSAMAKAAPKFADDWPRYRRLDDILDATRHRKNISDLWAWLGDYDVARPDAGALFDDVQLSVVPSHVEHTADGLNALLGTMSFWSRLSPQQREAIVEENRALATKLGRPIRSSTVACLATARRMPRS